MFLDRFQHYLSIIFFTLLVFTQALIFVAVRAADQKDLLPVIFIEPISSNIQIGQDVYFQAQLSNADNNDFDSVIFNLQNPVSGLDENYQASRQADGTWRAQSAWQTDQNYQPGQYYLSVVAYQYQDSQPKNIYASNYNLFNLTGQLKAAATTGDLAYFISPVDGSIINPSNETEKNLVVKYALDASVSRSYVKGVTFNIGLVGSGSDPAVPSFKYQAQIVGTESSYAIWQNAGTIDFSDLTDGDYVISTQVSYELMPPEIIDQLNNSDNSVNFTIRRSNIDISPATPTSVDIISPTSTTITSNQLELLVSPNTALLSGQAIIAKIIYQGTSTNFSDKTYTLVATNDTPAKYQYTVDLGTPSTDDSNLNTDEFFPNGVYNLSFELQKTATGQNAVLKQINITLDRNLKDISPSYSLIIDEPKSASIIYGNILSLKFNTSFSANNLVFNLIPQNHPELAISGTIPPVTGSNLYQSSVSASERGLVNDTYSLSATASDNQGNTATASRIVFIWQITEEETPIDPSLKAYQPEFSQVGPGDILMGSANVPDIKFKLTNVTDKETSAYTINHTALSCANSNSIFGTKNTQVAQTAGHNYCFYAVLPDKNSGSIPSGNYYFSLEHSETLISSEPVLLSYLNSDNQVPVADAEFAFLNLNNQSKISGRTYIVIGSNIDLSAGLEIKLKDKTNTTPAYLSAKSSAWSNVLLSNLGIKQSSYPDSPFVYISNVLDSTIWPNGTYELGIVGYEDTHLTVVIDNQKTPEPGDNSGTNTNQPTENSNQPPTNNQAEPILTPTVSSVNNLAIDYYATCKDQGINNEETCRQFIATVGLLNKSCLEQGIYDSVACEDYLYRLNIDAECQSNSIIEVEACKNYLLEKYGSQVSCRLGDINLCNNILRNKYLGRLVIGQKLSDSIKQTVDPLLGKNINLKELHDNFKNRGLDDQNMLPLNATENIKVLLAKAQKETILEEEDKLTILNQAVIILDSDGDNLPDDLEGYYGTDLNNTDTDGDGYMDGLEIINGYNPAGEGKLIQERTSFDLTLLSEDKTIEQPKIKSDKIDSSLKVETVEESDKKIKLFGQAPANTWVNLYLYSELPLVMATKTDASGNWSYDIKQSLTDGHHRVFVTVNDDTGKITKQSRPISFLIKEAQAVSAEDYFDEAGSSSTVNNFFIYYILGGAFLVFLALGILIFIHKGKRNLGV